MKNNKNILIIIAILVIGILVLSFYKNKNITVDLPNNSDSTNIDNYVPDYEPNTTNDNQNNGSKTNDSTSNNGNQNNETKPNDSTSNNGNQNNETKPNDSTNNNGNPDNGSKIDDVVDNNNDNPSNVINADTNNITSANVITPETYGAKGDGVTDDSDSLQKWLNAHINNKNLVFGISSKTYAISKGLNINYEEENYLIDFGNATLKATKSMNYMISINTLKQSSGYDGDISDKYRVIKGGHFEGNNLAKDIILYRSRKVIVSDMHLYNAKEKYVNVERGAIIFKDSFLDRRIYKDKDAATKSVGIYINKGATDSKISNIMARDIAIFTLVNGDSIFYNNCHAWIVNLANGNDYPNLNTIYCKYSKKAFFDNSYADTYNTVFEANSDSTVTWNNGMMYWNTSLIKKPASYRRPVILAHNSGYKGKIDVRMSNSNFELANLTDSKINKKAKYIDVDRKPEEIRLIETTLLENNKINPNHLDNFPRIAINTISNLETISARTENNGKITSFQVRHISNGMIYIKGKYTNALKKVTNYYGFAQMTTKNIKIAEDAFLTGVAYDSSNPTLKYPVTIDITTGGYLHTFVNETINNVDTIEFSGTIRCNLSS